MTDAAPEVPRLINISRWLWIVSGIVGIVSFVAEFTDRKRVVNELRRLQPQLGQDELDAAANGATLYNLFFAVGLAFLFVFLAQRMASGNGRARIILAILAVIGLFFSLVKIIVISSGLASALGFSVSPIDVALSVLTMIVELSALILMFQPSVTAYFQRNRVADTVVSIKN